MTENLLRHETSPYLLQHGDNPVHWRAWGPEAFAEARAADKPVLLSIGYAACHWCHVMAHESFEDADVAQVMNDLFVNIKVDREERPDVDTIYQSALALLGEQGGWPLTMFLTSDGEPFWGGTYFPKTARWGRPGFLDVLRSMAQAYHDDKERVGKNVEALKQGLARLAEPKPGGGEIAPAVLDQVARAIARRVDPFHGGIGDAPKFPHGSAFLLLWRAWKRTGHPVFRQCVVSTLVNMCQGGIYDHLGGGFARYSVDERWLVPHFEKMLYDNAQMIELLTIVWQDTRMPLFEQRLRETADWLLDEMTAPEEADGLAGFAATLDADSEGEEGKFYVWTAEEIDAVLGPDAGTFKRAYDIGPDGNWEGRTILNRLHDPDSGLERDPAVAAMRAKLKAARDMRVRPGRDDKVLADWNGMTIAALGFAARVVQEPTWLTAAVRAFDHVRTHMTADDGRLRHSRRLGRLAHPATLDDHAQMIRAALALHEAAGDARFLEQAEAWVADVERWYGDASGGWFTAAHDTELLITRPKSATDNATPSGAGVMVESLARLYWLTGRADYRDRATRALAAFTGELERQAFALATLLNGAELLQRGLQVVVVGEDGDADARALVDAVAAQSLPDLILTRIAPGAALPEGHPATGKGPVDGRAAAYVCEGPVCSLPLTEPDALAADLAARHAGRPETLHR